MTKLTASAARMPRSERRNESFCCGLNCAMLSHRRAVADRHRYSRRKYRWEKRKIRRQGAGLLEQLKAYKVYRQKFPELQQWLRHSCLRGFGREEPQVGMPAPR